MQSAPKRKLNQLSVFLPCYNEEKNVKNTFNKVIPIIKENALKWEVILVNDGSKDSTARVLSELKKQYPSNVKIITHEVNRGYGAAFKSGIYNSSYQWIAFTDADGQFDFSELPKFIEAQEKTQADLVIGYYLGRKVPIYRIWGSALWQLAVYLLFGLKVKDIDCGFKFFKKEVVDSIPKLTAERGPFITSEFLIHAKSKGYKIVEVGVTHFSRKEGVATGSKPSVVISGLKDLVKLKIQNIYK